MTRKILIVIGSVLIVSLLATSGVILLRRNNFHENKILAESPSPSLMTYAPQGKVFTVQYPSTWRAIAENKTSYNSVGTHLVPPALQSVDTNLLNNTFWVGTINLSSPNNSIEQVSVDTAGHRFFGVIEEKDITINGNKGHMVHWKQDDREDYDYIFVNNSGQGAFFAYSIKGDNRYFNSDVKPTDSIDNTPYLTDFQNIINSMRFLDASTPAPAIHSPEPNLSSSR